MITEEQRMQVFGRLIACGYNFCTDCDEWSEWVSCPTCDNELCGYCVSYVIDGTMECGQVH